jgi:hypothetical protein
LLTRGNFFILLVDLPLPHLTWGGELKIKKLPLQGAPLCGWWLLSICSPPLSFCSRGPHHLCGWRLVYIIKKGGKRSFLNRGVKAQLSKSGDSVGGGLFNCPSLFNINIALKGYFAHPKGLLRYTPLDVVSLTFAGR